MARDLEADDRYTDIVPQPENLPIGSGTPLAGLMDYNAGAAANSIDPMAQLGQNLGVEQFNMPVTPPANELDLSGDPAFAPLPADPSPSKADRLAAAKEILGTNEQPEQPAMVDKVVGKNSTTTTQQTQSPESIQAAADLEAAQAKAQQASDLEMKAADEQSAVEAKISEQDNNVIAQVESARARAQTENRIKFEDAIADIDARVAELSNFKPETFWGSKSTADKITAALSVGLGAYGQALLGSGSNIGQVLLERNMNEFDRNQQMEYNNKLKTIQNMKGSLDMKKQLADDAEKTFDAKKLAARAQVQSSNAKALAMAKTPAVKAGIMQRQAKMDADIAGKQAEIASKYEAKTSVTKEEDIIKQMSRTPGLGANGQPLTEGQNKARIAFSSIAGANQALKGVDLEKLGQDPDYLEYFKHQNSRDTLSKAPWIGNSAAGVSDILGGTPEEALLRRSPEIARAVSAMNLWTQGVVRFKTGATIGDQETATEMKSYWPVLGDSPQTIKDKAATRKELEKAMREAGAL